MLAKVALIRKWADIVHKMQVRDDRIHTAAEVWWRYSVCLMMGRSLQFEIREDVIDTPFTDIETV